MKKNTLVMLSGYIAGIIVSPVIAILVTWIFNITSTFVIMLSSTVIGVCMALCGKSIAEFVYHIIEEDENDK